MKVIGSHCFAHDGSMCVLEDGAITYWNKEERLSRQKRDRVPWRVLREIEDNFDLSDVDCFVTTRPLQLIPRERIKNADLLNIQFMDSIVEYVGRVYRDWTVAAIPSHHICHAANVFYASGFDRAYVLVSDGSGAFDSDGHGIEVETLYFCEYPTVFKVVYRTVNRWMGITKTYGTISALLGVHPMDNGKTMGLAAYGRANSAISDVFTDIDHVFPDNQEPLREVRSFEDFIPGFGEYEKVMAQLSSYLREPALPQDALRSMSQDDTNFQVKADIAYMAQRGSSDALLRLLKAHANFTECNNLCFSGGHAHNCLLNYEIVNAFDGLNLFPDPIASDDGLSIGAAKLVWYEQTQSKEKNPLTDTYQCGLRPKQDTSP